MKIETPPFQQVWDSWQYIFGWLPWGFLTSDDYQFHQVNWEGPVSFYKPQAMCHLGIDQCRAWHAVLVEMAGSGRPQVRVWCVLFEDGVTYVSLQCRSQYTIPNIETCDILIYNSIEHEYQCFNLLWTNQQIWKDMFQEWPNKPFPKPWCLVKRTWFPGGISLTPLKQGLPKFTGNIWKQPDFLARQVVSANPTTLAASNSSDHAHPGWLCCETVAPNAQCNLAIMPKSIIICPHIFWGWTAIDIKDLTCFGSNYTVLFGFDTSPHHENRMVVEGAFVESSWQSSCCSHIFTQNVEMQQTWTRDATWILGYRDPKWTWIYMDIHGYAWKPSVS